MENIKNMDAEIQKRVAWLRSIGAGQLAIDEFLRIANGEVTEARQSIVDELILKNTPVALGPAYFGKNRNLMCKDERTDDIQEIDIMLGIAERTPTAMERLFGIKLTTDDDSLDEIEELLYEYLKEGAL